MIGRFCFLLLLLGALSIGFLMGSGKWKGGNQTKPYVLSSIHPDREVAPTEYKAFAIVLHAHNNAPWCERALRSIFSQDYDYFRLIFVDDGSNDGTFAKVEQFITENGLQNRAILMKNDEPIGPLGSLYRAAEYCLDREIILPLAAQDWLVLPTALSRLNQVFQNPDVWISFSQVIRYPSYEMISPPKWDRATIEKEGYSDAFGELPCAFYGALFKQLSLSELLEEGRFIGTDAAAIFAMLQLSGGRFKSLAEPLCFQNQTVPAPAEEEESHTSHDPLTHFPSPSTAPSSADVLLFSYDRPMQLYATLESIQRYLTGFKKLSVLFRVSDERFLAAYNEVSRSFPSVTFIQQGDDPRKDFKPLLLKTVFDSPSKYILFGVDDAIFKESTDLNDCIRALDKTDAYGFYLRLGSHIQHSYQSGKPLSLPPSVSLNDSLFAWDLKKGELDWKQCGSLDMTLYSKEKIKSTLYELSYKSPNSLEIVWNEKSQKAIGLYFDHSRVVNIPLNALTQTGNPHMNYLSAEELLVKFNQHLKMDLDPLYQIENPSPHIDHIPDFVIR